MAYGGSMDIRIPTAEQPLTVSGAAKVLKGSYAALSVDAAALQPLEIELQAILGDDFEELKGHRDLRDGADRYHMTIIEPREFRKVTRELKQAGSKLELPKSPIRFAVYGVGTASSEGRSTWFAVCRSQAVADWRKSLGLPAKDLHITLAFGAGGDVHGVPKGMQTLISSTTTEKD